MNEHHEEKLGKMIDVMVPLFIFGGGLAIIGAVLLLISGVQFMNSDTWSIALEESPYLAIPGYLILAAGILSCLSGVSLIFFIFLYFILSLVVPVASMIVKEKSEWKNQPPTNLGEDDLWHQTKLLGFKLLRKLPVVRDVLAREANRQLEKVLRGYLANSVYDAFFALSLTFIFVLYSEISETNRASSIFIDLLIINAFIRMTLSLKEAWKVFKSPHYAEWRAAGGTWKGTFYATGTFAVYSLSVFIALKVLRSLANWEYGGGLFPALSSFFN
jgi:hypothetical protein